VKGHHYNIEHQSVPAFFIRGPSPLARLVFFSALSLTLIATDSHLKYLATIREKLEFYLHPFELMANAPFEFYRQTNDYFSTHHYLLTENKQLKNQAIKKNVDVQALTMLSVENDHLRSLVNAKSTLTEHSVLAEVLYVSRDRFTKKIVVNRGEKHQVVLGSAVIDGSGIIGQVTRLFPHTSVVTLITDKSLEIPVLVERNGLRAIAFGHGQDNVIEIPYLPTNVDIKTGDKLVTSGIDGVYPAGVAVAIVKKIDIAPGSPFARIICTPMGGTESNRQVLIVSMPAEAAVTANINESLMDTAELDAKATLPQAPQNASPAPVNNVLNKPLPSLATTPPVRSGAPHAAE
jgi:rod shape-determining protein MreC